MMKKLKNNDYFTFVLFINRIRKISKIISLILIFLILSKYRVIKNIRITNPHKINYSLFTLPLLSLLLLNFNTS